MTGISQEKAAYQCEQSNLTKQALVCYLQQHQHKHTQYVRTNNSNLPSASKQMYYVNNGRFYILLAHI